MEVSELVRSLLKKRGIEKESDVAAFLSPDYDLHTHDPFLLPDMDRAVERLLKAIELHERIAVYADFDCDGIPGAALLGDFFKKIGYDNVETYIPHRDREGYGLHTTAITELAAHGVSLIITVDVGTNAFDAVRFAKEKGVDTIVTDHHELSGTLPEAVAVLNPKRSPYPYPDLCGAAMAFKLVTATLREGKRRALPAFEKIPDGWEKWLLDLVAIATVADMVPLIGENRVLAHWGLKVLHRSPRVGIRALCTLARVDQRSLTEDDIGFTIAPRINAASRMDDPDLAFKLLTTSDSDEAKALAGQLEKLNASRKGIVSGIVREAKKHVRARFTPEEHVVVLGDTAWKPSLLGLAANSIMQERGGIVCLWGRDASGNLRGSCRADDDFSITELFANAGDVFDECGGHRASGGFSVSHEHVHQLPELLKDAAHRIQGAATDSSQDADVRLTLAEISRDFFADISRLAPFGAGNRKPVIRVSGVLVTGTKRFGKEKNHVEFSLECRTSGRRLRAFDFFRGPDDFSFAPAPGTKADILATLERDIYRGGLTLRLVDIMSVGTSVTV